MEKVKTTIVRTSKNKTITVIETVAKELQGDAIARYLLSIGTYKEKIGG